MEADQRAVVSHPRLLPTSRRTLLGPRDGVVNLHRAGGVARDGKGVGRRQQMHGLSMSIRNLPRIDRDLVERIQDRGDLEPASLTEVATYPLTGHRRRALDPVHGPVGEVHEQPHRREQLGLVEQLGCLGGVEPPGLRARGLWGGAVSGQVAGIVLALPYGVRLQDLHPWTGLAMINTALTRRWSRHEVSPIASSTWAR